MAEAGDWTRKYLERWRDAADRCWTALADGEDLRGVDFVAFATWENIRLVACIDLLAQDMGRGLARRGLDTLPFHRAAEKVRTYDHRRDGDTQDDALAAVRAALDFAAVYLERLGNGAKAPAGDPPPPAGRKRGPKEKVAIRKRNVRIAELVDDGKSPEAIVAIILGEFGGDPVSPNSIGQMAARGRAARDKK